MPETPQNSLRHIAVIMDGNGRWAKQRGLPSLAGHKQGVERVRDIMEACRDSGIETLTLFAFSSENWNRPKTEVAGLMKLFSTYLKNETRKLKSEGVRLKVIGSRKNFSNKLLQLIERAEEDTVAGKMTLVIAADYGGRWDITQAAVDVARDVQEGALCLSDVNEDIFNRYTALSEFAPPDLLIRTSGEQRISNFLLWQCAYSEFYFTDVFWPDFDDAQLKMAINEYHSRQRRYGLTAEQIEEKSGGKT